MRLVLDLGQGGFSPRRLLTSLANHCFCLLTVADPPACSGTTAPDNGNAADRFRVGRYTTYPYETGLLNEVYPSAVCMGLRGVRAKQITRSSQCVNLSGS